MNDLLMGRWTLFMDIYNRTIHKNELSDFVSESSRVLSFFNGTFVCFKVVSFYYPLSGNGSIWNLIRCDQKNAGDNNVLDTTKLQQK